MRLRPGLRPGPRWGSLERSPKPPSWFSEGCFVAGRGRKREEGEGKEERGKEGKGEIRSEEGKGRRWAIREKKWRRENSEQGRRLAKAGPEPLSSIALSNYIHLNLAYCSHSTPVSL